MPAVAVLAVLALGCSSSPTGDGNPGGPGGAPAVSVVSPADGASVSGTVTVQVQATDAEDASGTLVVEVSIDQGAWRTASWGGQHYELSWDSRGQNDGPSRIEARARDSGAREAVGDPLTVIVNNVTELIFQTGLDGPTSVTSPSVGTGAGAALRGVTFTGGRTGSAAAFDAVTDYIRVQQAEGAVRNVTLDQGSVGFWYRPNYDHDDDVKHGAIFSTGTWQSPGSLTIGKHNQSNGNAFFVIMWSESQTRLENTVLRDEYSWKAGDWVHVWVTWDWTTDGQNIRVYFNGAEAQVTRDFAAAPLPASVGPRPTPPPSASEYIWIGNRDEGGSYNTDGLIDDLVIYDRASPPPP